MDDTCRKRPLDGTSLCAAGHKARQPNSRGCFICGLRNPIGLRMVFYEDREEGLVWARLTISDDYCSYPGVVHGGIVATVLDETSGRALIVSTGDANAFFATAKIELRYRRATPTNVPLVAVGWVERPGESRVWVRGELRLEKGGAPVRRDPAGATVLAECKSLVVRPRPEFLAGWGKEAPHWRVYSDEELDRACAQGMSLFDNNPGRAL